MLGKIRGQTKRKVLFKNDDENPHFQHVHQIEKLYLIIVNDFFLGLGDFDQQISGDCNIRSRKISFHHRSLHFVS